jgi:hypothetical protein
MKREAPLVELGIQLRDPGLQRGPFDLKREIADAKLEEFVILEREPRRFHQAILATRRKKRPFLAAPPLTGTTRGLGCAPG